MQKKDPIEEARRYVANAEEVIKKANYDPELNIYTDGVREAAHRAEGLGSGVVAGAVFRRPSGLRGNGCGSQKKRWDLLLFVNRLRAGMR